MAFKAPIPGELRHYISFQGKSPSAVDAYGQRALAWAEIRSVWAKLEVKQAKEETTGDRKVQVSNFIFTIRNVPDIHSGLRILYRSSFYSIVSVYDAEGTGKWLTVEARLDPTAGVSVV